MINVDNFIKIETYYAFNAAEHSLVQMRVNHKQWNSGLDVLYTLLEPDNITNNAWEK